MWSSYVENDLIPRLNGFELLMASYAMAHLKLDLLLKETGYKPQKSQRFNVFLTNALEEHHPDTGTLFSQWLSDEANEANRVKRDTPVMVVMGNPPYSVSSSNNSKWIADLMKTYKVAVRGERNIQPLSDDYIKFIRFAQERIDQTGQGVIAVITNHAYLSGLIHRGMREELMKAFTVIYIIDLHGNSKTETKTPRNETDKNVFDIQQGVAIGLFIRHEKRTGPTQVKFLDLWGGRENKYNYLWEKSIQTIDWQSLQPQAPHYFFTPKDFQTGSEYLSGILLSKLFPVISSGLNTLHDKLVISTDRKDIETMINDATDTMISHNQFREKYRVKDSRDWKLQECLLSVQKYHPAYFKEKITKCLYRPFDHRWIVLDDDFVGYTRWETTKHFLSNNSIGFATTRQTTNTISILVSQLPFGQHKIVDPYDRSYVFPLYLYESNPDLFGSTPRKPNFDMSIITQIADSLGLTFCPDHELPEASNDNTFTPLDILDYIYAVLHSPTYRDTYKEFLKIDFPRVPYPTPDTFWQLVSLGGQLRQIHLLESPTVEQFITGYPMDGDNVVTRKMTKKSVGYEATSETHGRVWINDTQYFEGVPLTAWEFFIGGYQPAQKWLKDRHGRELNFDDLLHYQKIIVALTETHRLMGEIDKIGGLV